MMLAEQALNPVKGREYRLDLIIEATGDAFTDIVIDCPPLTLASLLTMRCMQLVANAAA